MENTSYTLIWAGWLLVLGVMSLPLTIKLFSKFFDNGYGLTKIITILFTSYFVFFFSTIRLLPFSRISLLIVLLMYIGLNIWIYNKNKARITNTIRQNIGLFFFEEILFLGGLFLWAFVRSHQPDINGLEKLMDFGFVNSVLRSEYLPPKDMWAAGYSINYYWYGHYITAFLTKLINIPSGAAYNLMLGTILGLSLTASFSLVSGLLWNRFKGKFKSAVIIGGFISAIVLNFAGNFHTPYFVLKNGVDKYWYPDATRFIGYNPDIDDKTIHEFPIYSYVVSDLHAHLLNLPFVLLFLALLYNLVLKNSADIKPSASSNKWPLKGSSVFKNLTVQGITTKLFFLGMLLGVMFMTNAWDFANYLLVAGFVMLLSNTEKIRKIFSIENLLKTTVCIVIILVTAFLTVIPFVMNFESIAEGVLLTHTKTPLWQLAILWGFPAFISILFVAGLVVFKKTKLEDVFILSILIASWMLIAIPEFVYVKDIYATSHYRANTMFKLTYQAYVMFYLSSGYIVFSLIKKAQPFAVKIGAVLVFASVYAAILYYPFLAVKSYYGNVFDDTNPTKSLSGDKWILDRYPDTFGAINWLKNNVSGQPVILEAPGDSYTDYNSISSYTGLPTVSGWYVHEWLWRGSPDFPQQRVNDITEIYNTENIELAKSLLTKYSVKYVIVGGFEKEKFPTLNEVKFMRIGKVVFESEGTKIFEVN